jgi:hypothetical protein
MSGYELGIRIGDFLSWEVNSEWSRKVCKKASAEEVITLGDVLYGDLVNGDFTVGKFREERRDWSFRFIALSSSATGRDGPILCLRRGAIVKGKKLNFGGITGEDFSATLELLDFSMISFSDGFAEDAFVPGEWGGESGSLSVPNDQFFDTEDDRDEFFEQNPDRLDPKHGDYAPHCVCDDQLQKYTGAKWQDITPTLKGKKGDKGDKGEDGPPGTPGKDGLRGETGEKGNDGRGIIDGGTQGQFLRKKSATDFDMEWANASSVSGVASVSGTMVDNSDTSNPIIKSDGSKANVDDLSIVATSGSYLDLDNKPLLADVATSGSYGDLEDTPVLAAVATSGSYDDLSGAPVLATVATTGSYNDLEDKPTSIDVPDLAAVATSGSYDDLTDTPDLAAVAISGYYEDLGNIPAFATVAMTGSYNDLEDKPVLADVATSGSYNDLADTPELANVATSGNYGDLSGKPALATVATSGSYNDLTGRPTNGSHLTFGLYDQAFTAGQYAVIKLCTLNRLCSGAIGINYLQSTRGTNFVRFDAYGQKSYYCRFYGYEEASEDSRLDLSGMFIAGEGLDTYLVIPLKFNKISPEHFFLTLTDFIVRDTNDNSLSNYEIPTLSIEDSVDEYESVLSFATDRPKASYIFNSRESGLVSCKGNNAGTAGTDIDLGSLASGSEIIFDFVYNETASGYPVKHEKLTGQFYAQGTQNSAIAREALCISGYRAAGATATDVILYRTEVDIRLVLKDEDSRF